MNARVILALTRYKGFIENKDRAQRILNFGTVYFMHLVQTLPKILPPPQYFSLSCAPYHATYCTSFLKIFKFICLHISYDLKYLLPTFVVVTVLLYVCVQYIESHSMCSLSIFTKVCVRVFIVILNRVTICIPQQSGYSNNVITLSKPAKTKLILITFE